MLKVCTILVALFAAYYFYWAKQDNRAQAAATQFCNAVPLGITLPDAAAIAKTAGARQLSGKDSIKQLFFFQGPIFNGYFCELALGNGRVTSRKVIRAED